MSYHMNIKTKELINYNTLTKNLKRIIKMTIAVKMIFETKWINKVKSINRIYNNKTNKAISNNKSICKGISKISSIILNRIKFNKTKININNNNINKISITNKVIILNKVYKYKILYIKRNLKEDSLWIN